MSAYDTFIVRIWSDGDDGMHGRVSHVASQEQRDFRDLDRMVDFILETIRRPGPPAVDPHENGKTRGET